MNPAGPLLLAVALAGPPARPPPAFPAPAPSAALSGEVTRTLLQRSDVPGTELETRLYLITYPAGAGAPRHTHPVVGLGYVLQGEAISAFEGKVPHRLAAGASFKDLADTPHVLFSNTSATKPLAFLVAYTVRKGEPVTLWGQN